MGRGSPTTPSARTGRVGWLPVPYTTPRRRPTTHDRRLLGTASVVSGRWSVVGQQEVKVSNYPIEELIARWKNEELTVEQVIGQMLQLLRSHEQRLRQLGRLQPETKDAPSRERRQG